MQSSRTGPDESHSTSPQENDRSALQKNVRRHSTRNRPLATRAMEDFAFAFLSPKPQRMGSSESNGILPFMLRSMFSCFSRMSLDLYFDHFWNMLVR